MGQNFPRAQSVNEGGLLQCNLTPTNPVTRAIFILSGMSKVTRDCIGFALLRFVISSENLRHSLNQSDAKIEPRQFSRFNSHFSLALKGIFLLINRRN